MTPNDERDFEKLLESAYHHTVNELGIENVKPSLKLELEGLRKAHDAIHEYMYLAPLLVPSQIDKAGWPKKSAFLLYHWEAFHHAHRSLLEALCTYYNVAFILLRATFELVIKGAFWECLSDKKFRDNSQVLDNNKQGKETKKWLGEEEFKQISAGIFDIKTIICQLDQWGMFNPITEAETRIYKGIYGRLSADVHVIPDRTDIGKRLITESSELFKQELLTDVLHEYADSLHEIIDLAIVIELNISVGDWTLSNN
jgi:hypothetical protein